MVTCVLNGHGCFDPGKLKDLSELTDKGYPTLLKYSINFDADHPGLTAVLTQKKAENEKLHLHRKCQKRVSRLLSKRKYCDDAEKAPSPRKTRSRGSFVWGEDCFYCGDLCIDDDGRSSSRYSSAVRQASTLEFKDNLLKTCERRHDVWGNEVKLRIVKCSDFPAAKARYHIKCLNRFNVTAMAPKRLESTLNSSFLQGSIDISR